MPCCINGIMAKTQKMEILTTQRYEAASSFGGSGRNAQRVMCTAGRLRHAIVLPTKLQQDALSVLGTSFVSATLWKLSVLILLLILTLKRMVSLLLR